MSIEVWHAHYRDTGLPAAPQIGEALYFLISFFPPCSYSQRRSRATGARVETEGNLDVLRSVGDSSRLSVQNLKTCQQLLETKTLKRLHCRYCVH